MQIKPGQGSAGGPPALGDSWFFANALRRCWYQNAEVAATRRHESDSKRRRGGGLAFPATRQRKQWSGISTDEGLYRRAVGETRMRPVERVVGEGVAQALFQDRKVERWYQSNLRDLLQGFPESLKAGGRANVVGSGVAPPCAESIHRSLKTPATNSPPRSVTRYFGGPNAATACLNNRAIAAPPGLRAKAMPANGRRENASKTAAK